MSGERQSRRNRREDYEIRVKDIVSGEYIESNK